MTLLPQKKKCPICGRTYSWNPDVGKILCPYCKEKTKGRMSASEDCRKIFGNRIGNKGDVL